MWKYVVKKLPAFNLEEIVSCAKVVNHKQWLQCRCSNKKVPSTASLKLRVDYFGPFTARTEHKIRSNDVHMPNKNICSISELVNYGRCFLLFQQQKCFVEKTFNARIFTTVISDKVALTLLTKIISLLATKTFL